MANLGQVCKSHPEYEIVLTLWCGCGHQLAAHLLESCGVVRCRYAGKRLHRHWRPAKCFILNCPCTSYDYSPDRALVAPADRDEIPACSPVPDEDE